MRGDFSGCRGRALLVKHSSSRDDRIKRQLVERGVHITWACPVDGDPLPPCDGRYDLVVVYGGPQSANDDAPYLCAEREWIRRWVSGGGLFLGLCLGAQLLARALGARVRPHPEGGHEVGYRCIYSTAAGAGMIQVARPPRRPAGSRQLCLRALRKGDVLVVWKLDRLGNLAHLVNTVQDLSARGVGLRVLAGQGAQIDTTTAAGRLVFGIFTALAEFERELIRERTVAGLKGRPRARVRKGGRKFALSKAQVRLAQAAMAHRDTSASALCRELGIRPVTLYRSPFFTVSGAWHVAR